MLSPFARLRACLEAIYDSATAARAYEQIKALLTTIQLPPTRADFLSEGGLALITYGDSLRGAGESPLYTLHQFLRERLQGVVDTVHILPFYHWSSDDGFSVIDYQAVDSALGSWADIESLGQNFRLMFDAVINHMSAQSGWFQAFLNRDPDYAARFFVESPQADLSAVTRPRISPLLTSFTLSSGQTVHVWTTFSADQVDLDYRDPRTLLAILDVLLFYVGKGAQVIRLDAIAYMWKAAGTSCIHLPQTHALIRLIRAALDVAAPHVTLITEANVPHAENTAYFGDGTDEAQLVYNFTLPPLLLHSMIREDGGKLVNWINSLETPSNRTAFFNFTASHDGIGVRPVEGILTRDELAGLVDLTLKRGGRVSYKRNLDGTDNPYELNVTYVDALADPALPLDLQVWRFLLSQGVMLALAGVPVVYIHSLLGSHNDLEGMQPSGINRAKLELEQVYAELETPESFRARVFDAYCMMIRARRASSAFHPAGSQHAQGLNEGRVLWLERVAPEGVPQARVVVLLNLSGTSQTVAEVPGGIHLLTRGQFIGGVIPLAPYEMHWIKVVE